MWPRFKAGCTMFKWSLISLLIVALSAPLGAAAWIALALMGY
jgi:hypothetical protein